MVEKRPITKPPTLGEKISAAFGNGRCDSGTLSELIFEVEAGIAQADRLHAEQNALALDISTTDARACRDAALTAELERDRYAAALPRLRQLLQQALADEQHDRWSARYTRHNADTIEPLVKEFTDFYLALLAKAPDLLQRVQACDRESDAINGDAPDDESRRCNKVELLSRQLESFSRTQPSIIELLTVPNWDISSENAWPPRPVPMTATFASAAIPHRGSEWWRDSQIREAERRVESARVADYYSGEAATREAKENEEEARKRQQQGRT